MLMLEYFINIDQNKHIFYDKILYVLAKGVLVNP